jgi:hypothetical protein
MLYHVTIGGRVCASSWTATARVDGIEIPHADLVALPGTPVRHLLADGRSRPSSRTA